MSRCFRAISLFSGAGGMDLGVLQAGFEVMACIEIDPYCCETLRAAAKRDGRTTKVIEADIRTVRPSELMIELGLKPGELDLLFGGPPCQAFSQIGKQRALKDERGTLLFEVVRFAEAFFPRVIMIEQVKGLVSARDEAGRRGGVLRKLISCLESLGYDVVWRVINAADYGVPQLRQRLFIIATLPPNTFSFPAPTHGNANGHVGLLHLQPYVTVREALRGLGTPACGKGAIREDSHVDITPDGDRRRIHGVPEGSFLAAQIHLPATQRCNLTLKDTTKFRRLSWSAPSNTLRCGEIFFHPTEDRYLTPREYMRLHGYPDDYYLKGPIRGRSGRVRNLDQYRQVANSVPPPVARVMAEAVKELLRGKDAQCQSSLRSSAIV